MINLIANESFGYPATVCYPSRVPCLGLYPGGVHDFKSSDILFEGVFGMNFSVHRVLGVIPTQMHTAYAYAAPDGCAAESYKARFQTVIMALSES